MKTVRFNRLTYPNGSNFTPFQPGDIAGFEDKLADRLIRDGSARAYTSPADKQSDGRMQNRRGNAPVTKRRRGGFLK